MLKPCEAVDEPRPTYDCGQLMQGSSTGLIVYFHVDGCGHLPVNVILNIKSK